jgi:xanthine dehydrogenase accessory factor
VSEIRVLIRGGGDLASGVAARLFRAGFKVLVTELPQPLVVRRLVSFAEAVFVGELTVEDIRAVRAERFEDVAGIQDAGQVAVLVDPPLDCLPAYKPQVVVDARMRKKPPESTLEVPLHIGLGPGFTAGKDCHAVIETMRGHTLGRVIWQGQASANTGIPEEVLGKTTERVLRAPADGVLLGQAKIGDVVRAGDLLAIVGDSELHAPFNGALRGLVHDGLEVFAGMKIGDLDPRGDPKYARLISDKSLAIGGAVLEAVLSSEKFAVRSVGE